MSAFIVDDIVIQEVLSFIDHNTGDDDFFTLSIMRDIRLKDIDYILYKRNNPLTKFNLLETFGQIILKKNFQSVKFLYGNKIEKDESKNFKYVLLDNPCSKMQFLKYIDCLDYQSCELNDYYENPKSIYRCLNKLRTWCVSLLDGYEQASWCGE